MKYSDPNYRDYLGPFGEKVRDLNWKDVIEIWKNNEENLEHWKNYWQSKGFNSWQEWRERFFSRFGIKDLAWSLMETEYSSHHVPHWRYANFKGWNKLAQANKYNSFYRLARHEMEKLENYEPLVRLIEDFPVETTVIGIELGKDLYIIEGMHRCASIAVAHWQGKRIETNIRVAVGKRVGSRPRFFETRVLNPEVAELIMRLGI